MRSVCRSVLPAVLVLALALPVSTQSGSPVPAQAGNPGPRPSRGPELWWREKSPISKELGLSKDQANQIEKVFQDTKSELTKRDQDLRNRENMLSKMIQDNVPESAISPMIDHVEATRSALNKTRQLMLYHMRQVLTTPQRARFETLHEQFQAELQQAATERRKQDQKRKQEDSHNSNQSQKAAPDPRGRPGA